MWLIQKILDPHRFLAENLQPASIPIGNLTSQFFANIYVFHDDKQFLREVKEKIARYLLDLHLHLHEEKCRVFNTGKGVPFLGLVMFSYRRRLKKQNIIRFKRRLNRFQKQCGKGLIGGEHIHQSIQSWIGHAAHANTVRLRKLLLEEVVFRQERGIDQS